LLRFDDSNEGEDVVCPLVRDMSYQDGMDTTKIGLDDFFDRWIQIQQYSWSEGSSLYQKFDPWTNYFTHPTVYSKLKGYSRIHATMELKFILNASPFQFGMAMVSYHPMASASKHVITEGTTTYSYSGGVIDNTFDGNVPQGVMARSCRPHVFLYPQNNIGAEMELPMLTYLNWIYPASNTPLTTGPTPPYITLDEMGEATIESLAALQVAGTATGIPVTITVFARAKNVELSGPSMIVQSSMGVVSTPAAVVQAVSSAASGVPVIGPYMKPVEAAAKYTGDIAKFLGLHTLPVRDTPALRQHTIPGLANPGVCAHMDKLTLDPDNALCLDSRTVGLDGVDHMSISHIIKRETYLTSSIWSPSTVVGSSIFAIAVLPDLWSFTTRTGYSTTNSYYTATGPPVAYVASAFQFWRGSLKFTFRVVAPLMNRGRLKLTWDPSYFSGSVPVEGVLHTEILDLSKSSEVSFTAPYMAFLPWLYTNTAGYWGGTTSPWAITPAGVSGTSNGETGFNGLITLTVLNRMVGPDITQNAQLHVFVEPGEDFEFAAPQSIPVPVRGAQNVETSLSDLYTVQSHMQLLDDKRETDLGISTRRAAQRAIHSVCMGEKVESIRALCRRFSPSFPQSWVSSYTYQWSLLQNAFGRFPPHRGPSGQQIHGSRNGCVTVDSNGTGYNFVPHSFLTWFAPCYVGWRGSVNWKLVQLPAAPSQTVPMNMTLSRAQFKALPSVTNYSSSSSAIKSISGIASILATTKPSGMDGITASDGVIQPCTDAAFPMYQNYRMMPCNPLYNTPYAISDPAWADRYGQDTDVVQITAEGVFGTSPEYDGTFQIRTYVAAGDDFSLFFFLNPPTVYIAGAAINPSTTN